MHCAAHGTGDMHGAASVAGTSAMRAGAAIAKAPSLPRAWPEYLMEAAGLGTFMLSACVFGVLLEHPDWLVRPLVSDAVVRRALMGVAMGATAIGIIYSPWGRRSGAHINPSVTLAFLRLGRIEPRDAFFYVAAQLLGAVVGVCVASSLLGEALAHPAVRYVATVPGAAGPLVALVAEGAISALLMAVVLAASDTARVAPYTGLLCGGLVASYITLEAPLSGMSMNPARTLASAVFAGDYTALWIYVSAPPAAMILAADLYARIAGPVACAKLCHDRRVRCIFCEHRHPEPRVTPLAWVE